MARRDQSHAARLEAAVAGEVPRPPRLGFAFEIAAEIGPAMSGGRNGAGERLHIPILGGRVSGPRLSGAIVPGGSDWPLIRPDGTSQIDAHYSIRADDGTLIYVRNRGLRVSTPEVTARLRAGEPVDPAEYYFRSAPQFDAPDGPHGWLRDRLFIAALEPRGRLVVVRVFEVG